MGSVCFATYSQSKPFIVLFGFHWNLLPTTTLLKFVAIRHSFAARTTFPAIQGVIMEANAPATARGIFHFLRTLSTAKHTGS